MLENIGIILCIFHNNHFHYPRVIILILDTIQILSKHILSKSLAEDNYPKKRSSALYLTQILSESISLQSLSEYNYRRNGSLNHYNALALYIIKKYYTSPFQKEPFRMIIQGTTCIGKSYLIDCLRKIINITENNDMYVVETE